MASIPMPEDEEALINEKRNRSSIVNDFMYGSNVAQCHVKIRMGFLRKVYGILSVQLILSTVTAGIIRFSPWSHFHIRENPWVVMVMLFSSMVLLVCLHIKRKETPVNFILLGFFTFSEAFTVGVIVTYYDQVVVLQAFILTTLVVVGLTVYTLQTKRDFSKWGAGLFAGLLVLIIGGFLQIVLASAWLETVMAIGGALLFCGFIIYDTHVIMHQLSPEEYILATINLYLDIINLFLHILRILDAARKN